MSFVMVNASTETCLACREEQRARGVLCATCARDLIATDLCAEQISARERAPVDGCAHALVIDAFGCPHLVVVPRLPGAIATLGRATTADVRVVDRGVSHVHAHLEYRPLSNSWFVGDGDSANGTFVDDDRVARRFPLEARDRISLGDRARFLFVPFDDDDIPRIARELCAAIEEPRQPTQRFVREPVIALTISPVREGGAWASWATHRVQLTELELELLSVLHRHHEDDRNTDTVARGYVPARHLIEKLSFVSEDPTHANLRGLVRKVRKKLAEGDPPVDVIESRQGLGYRLARPVLFR